MKSFMEKDLGWKCIKARTSGQDIHYLMQKGNQVLQLETKADGSYLIAYCQENRIIPNLELIAVALKLQKATKLDQCRILSQVIDMLLSRHRGATESEVQDMMQSFASGRRKPW
jgi:hypothetical protein